MTELRRVLVIDDDETSLELFRSHLEGSGHEVRCLTSWSAAAQVVVVEKFDILFCDVMMPGLSGDRLVRLVRDIPAGRALPIVLFSSLSLDVLRERAIACGADDWLQKPISAEPILEMIERHTRLAKPITPRHSA